MLVFLAVLIVLTVPAVLIRRAILRAVLVALMWPAVFFMLVAMNRGAGHHEVREVQRVGTPCLVEGLQQFQEISFYRTQLNWNALFGVMACLSVLAVVPARRRVVPKGAPASPTDQPAPGSA